MLILICPKCERKLRNYGDVAFSIYQQICESVILLKKNYQYEREIAEIIRFLETKGYVITTECESGKLMAQPQGHEQIAPTEHYFCINLKAHSKNSREKL